MSKQLPKSKPNYSLRRRFFNQIGEPLAWQDYGQGYFTDLETVQRQIKILASVGRKVEIEFVKDGILRDYQGNEIGRSIIYDKR